MMRRSSHPFLSDRLSSLLRPVVSAIEEAWPHASDDKRRHLMRQAHQALAALAELEEEGAPLANGETGPCS